MPQGSSFRLIAGIAFGLAAASGAAAVANAQTADGPPAKQEPAVADDPYQWLEDVKGDKAIAWVRQHNAKTEAELATTPQFKQLESDIRAILDSDAKIPGVEKIGDRTTTTSGRTSSTSAACGAARRWTSTARPSRSGKPSSTSTR